MKAVQIKCYSKEPNIVFCDIPIPEISDSEVLMKVKAAAVNPLEILILTGSIKLLQNYSMPLTLGNEWSYRKSREECKRISRGRLCLYQTSSGKNWCIC